MRNQSDNRQPRIAHEKSVQRYLAALERGDMDTIISVLHEAEHDPALERMVLEAHEEYLRENQEAPQPGQIAAVRYRLLNALDAHNEEERQEIQTLFSRPFVRRRRVPRLLQTIAAVIIVCALIGSAYLIFGSRGAKIGGSQSASVLWKVATSPNPGAVQNYLDAVSGTSADDVWAVGQYSSSPYNDIGGKTLIEHWNGVSWSVSNSPGPLPDNNSPLDNSLLTGAAAISPNDAWAVGYTYNIRTNLGQALIEHWNGTSWTIVKSSNPSISSQLRGVVVLSSQLAGVAALSNTDAWAVGWYTIGNNKVSEARTLIEHWNGLSWRIVPGPSPSTTYNNLSDIAAVSPGDIWAAGEATTGNPGNEVFQTLIEHWNGKTWSVVQSPNPGADGNNLAGIAAISGNNVWVVGSSTDASQTPGTLVEHWNGILWSVVQSANPGIGSNSLNAVAALAPNDIWAVGNLNDAFTGNVLQPLIEHWNGSSWSAVKSSDLAATGVLYGVVHVPRSITAWTVGEVTSNYSPTSTPGSGATPGASTAAGSPISIPTTGVTQADTSSHTLIASCCG